MLPLLFGLLMLALGCGAGTQARGAGTAGQVGRGGVAGAGGMTTDGTGGTGATDTGGSAGSGTVGIAGAGASGGGAGSRGGGSGSGGAGGVGGGVSPLYPLGMNDVTILVPLPASGDTPRLLWAADLGDDATALVPRALFDRLVAVDGGGSPVLDAATYDRLHLVAVRFDLCDRLLPGVCPEGEDGRMRLIFQSMFKGGTAEDVGFHAFYSIPRDQLDAAVASLRELAKTAPAGGDGLQVSPALSAAAPEAYATQLRAFVRRYGGASRLVRLTMNAQGQIFAQAHWILRGVEKTGDAFTDMPVVGSTATVESVIFNNGPSYDVTPVTDTPSGLRVALTQTLFGAADATTRLGALAALAAADNPLTHSTQTVPCVACHVSTVLMSARGPADATTIPGRYTSTFELSTGGGESAKTPNTLRALGYLGQKPMISQRVVNETAQVLTEIQARW